MKKLSYILSALLLLASMGMLSSCSDNENFSNLHVLTQDELDEMARQQRIADSLKTVINADLILSYIVEDYPLTGWHNNELKIETDKIAALFGLTEEQVIAGINQEAGAPDIKGFAIQGSTHADVGSASNTNGTWGHWWDKEGNVCTSYNQEEPSPSAFYCEWDGTQFGVGQFPGHLEAGDTITVLEGLKYQDLRVVCAITFICVERGEVKAEIVKTNKLELTTEQDNNYATVPVPGFDAAEALSLLGVSSWDEVAWVAINADGSYAQESDAGAKGFWYDKLGFKGSWGDDASVYTDFDGENILIGQMPNQMEPGSTVTVSYGAVAGSKIVMNEITVNVIAKGDVNGNVVATKELTLNTSPNDAYAMAAVPDFDPSETLSLLGAASWAEVKWVTVDAEGNYIQDYNADAPGFWYGKDGYIGSWGDDASVFAHFDAAEQFIGIGQMPGQMPAGSSVTIRFGATANDKVVMFVITVNIVAYQDPETAPEGTPESIEKDITLSKVYDADWGATAPFDVKEDLRQAFKMTTYQIFSAIKSGDLKMWIDEKGSPANEDGSPAYTGEAPGYWLSMEGKAAAWGSGSENVYIFLGNSETELYFYAANHPDPALFPATGGSMKVKYIIECNGVTATYNITFNITAAAAARRQ